jgi:hypothetical protein
MKHFQKYNCMPTASITSTLSIQLHENISMGQENFEKISEARETIFRESEVLPSKRFEVCKPVIFCNFSAK